MSGFVQVRVLEYWQELEIDGVMGNQEKSFCIIAFENHSVCYIVIIENVSLGLILIAQIVYFLFSMFICTH